MLIHQIRDNVKAGLYNRPAKLPYTSLISRMMQKSGKPGSEFSTAYHGDSAYLLVLEWGPACIEDEKREREEWQCECVMKDDLFGEHIIECLKAAGATTEAATQATNELADAHRSKAGWNVAAVIIELEMAVLLLESVPKLTPEQQTKINNWDKVAGGGVYIGGGGNEYQLTYIGVRTI